MVKYGKEWKRKKSFFSTRQPKYFLVLAQTLIKNLHRRKFISVLLLKIENPKNFF